MRDLRDSACRTFGRWLTNKNWSQLSSAESWKDKFHIFITELQNAGDTYLPWKTVRIHPTDRSWTMKRIKMPTKKRQTAFIRDGRGFASYRLLRKPRTATSGHSYNLRAGDNYRNIVYADSSYYRTQRPGSFISFSSKYVNM